jgi:hypothetical protein
LEASMRGLMQCGAIALLLAPVVAWSQEPPAIVAGSRVRITELGAATGAHAGTVVTASADTVVLKLDNGGQTAAFSLAKISELEVSRGLHGHAGAGVGLGFLAGLGAGALVGSLVCGGESACYSGNDDMSGPVTAVAAGLGGVVGMAVGAVVGGNHKTEKWEAVPSSGWHVSALPSGRGRFALALSVRF